MKFPLVITGSLAYDHVMTFPDKFTNHILMDKIHQLNVSFNIDQLEVNLGGTAGNIAYNLALLHQHPIIHATAGSDFDKYADHLHDWDLGEDQIKIMENKKTAQAFITTDLSSNQITAFYGGAMYEAHQHPLDLKQKSLVIISPNGIQAMVDHANYCQHNEHPFLLDPGQALNALSGDQLVKMIKNSEALIVNDYEWSLFVQKTGWTQKETLQHTKAIITTLGANGSQILTRDDQINLSAVSNIQVIDPTGAGDAYRAGLLYGISLEWDLKTSAQLATVLASFCVEAQGPQNHSTNRVKIADRYEQTWGSAIKLIF